MTSVPKSDALGDPEKLYFTSNEVGALLGVAANTVRLWSEKGLLRAQTTAGGHRRFPRNEVERFLRERDALATASPTEPRRVLVVDDDPMFARYLYALVTGVSGIAVEAVVATDGFAVGDLLHTFRPHAILLDLMMPGLDGFQVCQRVKSDPATRATRIIAITGHPSPENTERIVGAGAEACLTKPLDDDELLSLLGLATPRAVAAAR